MYTSGEEFSQWCIEYRACSMDYCCIMKLWPNTYLYYFSVYIEHYNTGCNINGPTEKTTVSWDQIKNFHLFDGNLKVHDVKVEKSLQLLRKKRETVKNKDISD